MVTWLDNVGVTVIFILDYIVHALQFRHDSMAARMIYMTARALHLPPGRQSSMNFVHRWRSHLEILYLNVPKVRVANY